MRIRPPSAAVVAAAVVAAVLGTVVVTTSLVRAWDAEPRPSTGSAERTIRVNGHQLLLVCQGTGGPTVVYDAGLGDSGQAWDRVLRHGTGDAGRACAYDRLGNGGSDAGTGARSVADAAADLRALLSAAGERPPYVLVSHSIAGLIHRYYTKLFPAEVAGLVMVDTAPDDWDLHNELAVFTSGGESLDVSGAAASLRAADDLGDRPTVVVQAARTSEISTAPGFPAYWRAAQRALAGLSTDAVLVVADSNHGVPASRPGLVAAAVALVSRAVRDGTALPGCASSPLPELGGACEQSRADGA